jgi:protein phosphatase
VKRTPTGLASQRGTRPHNADAAAIRRHGGRTAAALVDGIGSSAEVAATSPLLAEVAARVAVRRGPLAGLLAAAELIADPADGDAVAVVALAEPGGPTGVAWVGDCRAYGWDGTKLRLYTTDHTVGQQLRQNGVPLDVAEQHDNWVRTSLGRAVVATVYQVRIPAGELVVLTGDGVHDALSHAELTATVRAHVGDPQALADALVAAVGEDDEGERDDATAVVIRGDVEAEPEELLADGHDAETDPAQEWEDAKDHDDYGDDE